MALVTAVIVIGCGGTTAQSPFAATPIPGAVAGPPAAASPYPSLIGDATQWRENNSSFAEQVVGSTTPAEYNCNTRMSVRAQTEGMFTGIVYIEGISPDSDRRCTYESPFVAAMTPDGTITSFRTDRPLPTSRCGASSESAVSGAATTTAIRIAITQRATCVALSGTPRDTDLTIVMSVARMAPIWVE